MKTVSEVCKYNGKYVFVPFLINNYAQNLPFLMHFRPLFNWYPLHPNPWGEADSSLGLFLQGCDGGRIFLKVPSDSQRMTVSHSIFQKYSASILNISWHKNLQNLFASPQLTVLEEMCKIEFTPPRLLCIFTTGRNCHRCVGIMYSHLRSLFIIFEDVENRQITSYQRTQAKYVTLNIAL